MADSLASFTEWIQNALKSIGEAFSNLWKSLFPVRDKILAHPEYQAERERLLREVTSSFEEKGIAVDANGYVSIAELHAKKQGLPVPFYVDAKDGKLPLETVAKLFWNMERVAQGKEMVLNDKETFVEKMPNAIRESGRRKHFGRASQDREGS